MSNNSAELLKEFLGTNKNAKTILDKDAFYKVDLLSMDSRAIMEYCIAYSVSISTELPMVQKIRANMNLFFQYAQQKGYIQHNVFDYNDSSLQVWYDYAIDLLDIQVYYPKDIDKMISKVKYNKEFIEVIVRMLYEGLHSVVDLIYLKPEHIDFENNIINNGTYGFHMSDKLADAIHRYENIHSLSYVSVSGVDTVEIYQTLDYFIKTPKTYDNNLKQYKNYILNNLYMRMFNMLANDNGMNRISTNDIFASGFICFVKNECDKQNKSNSYFTNIFSQHPNGHFKGILLDYANKYGMNQKEFRSGYLRIKYYPYVYKSKYFAEEDTDK